MPRPGQTKPLPGNELIRGSDKVMNLPPAKSLASVTFPENLCASSTQGVQGRYGQVQLHGRKPWTRPDFRQGHSGRTGLFHSDWKQIPQVQRSQVWLLCEHRHVLAPHPCDPHLVLAAQTLPRALTGEETEVG